MKILLECLTILIIPISFSYFMLSNIFTCSYSNSFKYCNEYISANITILSEGNSYIGEYYIDSLLMQCEIKDLNYIKNITENYFNGYYTNEIFTVCVTQNYVDNYIKNEDFKNNILLSGTFSVIVWLIVFFITTIDFKNCLKINKIFTYDSLENERQIVL